MRFGGHGGRIPLQVGPLRLVMMMAVVVGAHPEPEFPRTVVRTLAEIQSWMAPDFGQPTWTDSSPTTLLSLTAALSSGSSSGPEGERLASISSSSTPLLLSSVSVQPNRNLDIYNDLYCSQFSEFIKNLDATASSFSCQPCNSVVGINCTAVTNIDCISVLGGSFGSVCYNVTVSDQVDFTAQPDTRLYERAVTLQYTTQDDVIEIVLTGTLNSELKDNGSSNCTFYWNNRACNSCDAGCLTPQGIPGFSLDCSNLDPDQVLDCVPNNNPKYIVSPTVITFFAVPANTSTSNSLEQYCTDFGLGLQALSSDITSVSCDTCNETAIVCAGDLRQECVPSLSRHDNASICFTGQVVQDVDLSNQPWSVSSELILVYENPTEETGPNSIRIAITGYLDSETKRCEFYWNGTRCNTCDTTCQTSSIQSGQGFGVDCSNLRPGTTLSCVSDYTEDVVFSPTVVALFAHVPGPEDEAWQRLCNDLQGGGINSTTDCSACNPLQIDCSTILGNQECFDLTGKTVSNICYSAQQTVLADVLNDQLSYTTQYTYTFDRDSFPRVALLTVNADLSTLAPTGCQFQLGNVPCNGCTLCGSNQSAYEVDCTNVKAYSSSSCTMDPADLLAMAAAPKADVAPVTPTPSPNFVPRDSDGSKTSGEESSGGGGSSANPVAIAIPVVLLLLVGLVCLVCCRRRSSSATMAYDHDHAAVAATDHDDVAPFTEGRVVGRNDNHVDSFL